MFKLFYKNKKGFSFHELLITITIVGLVVAIGGTILYIFQNQHTRSTYRWRIQNAVQLASTKFETETNLIVNSKMLDVFYDKTVNEGILYDKETGTFTWKNGTPYVFPDENTADGKYSYIFSTPAWDAADPTVFLGHYLFIKNYNDTVSTLFLDDQGFGDTPVQIELSISTDELEYETGAPAYQSNGVKIIMKSGREDILEYQVETIYVLENFRSGKSINYENGSLYYEKDWIEGTVACAYPCGWADADINSAADKNSRGYPNNFKATAADDSSSEFTFTSQHLEANGNVLRFLSPLSDSTVEKGDGQGSTTHLGSCISTWTFSDGTATSERVLNNLRNFRDNVLRGTTVGDWFIKFYYNDMSPFLIEHTAFLKPVYKVVLKPLSYVCDFIANL